MAKSVKKKNLKLKRRIRKTAGALFLISSLLVAAIPVDNLSAADGDSTSTIEATEFPAGTPACELKYDENTVPEIPKGTTVYTTGDGKFQYAYAYKRGQQAGDKVAVILGYSGDYLDNNTLTIPDTVDIYRKQTHSEGTSSGYIAVGASENDLWYKVKEQAKDEFGNELWDTEFVLDADGNKVLDENGQFVTIQTEVWTFVMYPCYYENYAQWADIPLDQLYTNLDASGNVVEYSSMTDGVNNPKYYTQTTNDKYKRIKSINVAYIGNQTISLDSASEKWVIGDWITADEEEKKDVKGGVFANNGNIVTLNIGKNLLGIGDFAFYNCSGLSSVSLENGLQTIGNYAFANCVNLKTVNISPYCSLLELGEHCFFNCRSLSNFVMPISVKQLGDYCFAKCSDLTSITMHYEDGTKVLLDELGNYCFLECSSLERLVFPAGVVSASNKNPLDISLFKGCKKLKSITFRGDNINVVENTDYDFDAFKKEVSDEFYFEGMNFDPSGTNIHSKANDEEITYKYLDQELYERVKLEDGKKAVFCVDNNNALVKCVIDDGFKNIELPEKFGPYWIGAIDSNSFHYSATNPGACTIEKITIPASVTSIADYAFQGCHSLKHVIFSNADNVQSIGTDAFQTQKISCGCGNSSLSNEPQLTFTGTVSNSSVPFQYAMNPASKINQGTQKISYVTYYSGWPSNLTIQYTEDKNAATLIDYPTLKEVADEFGAPNAAEKYPYMTDEYIDAAANMILKLGMTDTMTEDERAIYEACLNIVIPEGVVAVKDELFKNDADAADSGYSKYTKTVTTNSITNISDEMFEGWTNLRAAYLLGDATTIGNYVFNGCTALDTVQISANVDYLGLRPFIGCTALNDVDFLGSSNYVCDRGIIYSLKDGARDGIIECLETRGVSSGVSGVILGNELAGITYIQNEAFKDCLGISEVDLRQTTIDKIPAEAFSLDLMREDGAILKSLSKMNRVLLPSTCKSIEAGAFTDSTIVYVEIPSSVTYIDPAAFTTEKNINDSYADKEEFITFYCEPDSAASIYADNHESIDWVEREPDPETFAVTLQYLDPTTQQYHTIEIQSVQTGQSALKPPIEDLPVIEGYSFLKWLPSDDFSNILADCTYTAIYSNTQYTVNFFECDDHGNTPIGSITVAEGANVTELDYPEYTPQEGYTIVGWTGLVNPVTENLNVYAKCQEASYTVNFWTEDGSGTPKLVYTQTGKLGDAIYRPRDPQVDNATFTGWLPAVSETITGNADYYATFKDKDGNVIGGGEDTGIGSGDSNNNNGNNGNNSDNNNNPSATATPAPAKFYTLTVKNGSGSGSYAAGQDVIIIADDPVSGQTFSKWTVDPADVAIASKTVEATVLTMPEKNVTVTASYKKSASTSTGSGSGSSSNSGGTSHITGGNITTNGSTVVIDKNGLSNTGVVSVKVNGSSDNFTVKIQESAYAKEQAIKALIAEYGDLTNIVYFPMDISLYDSTGTKMITDTTGLSISITLPLPDSMIAYAGNNKVASVTDGVLEKLSAKFTTIDGVSCITFTAEHFSPYVIYVDKGNLSAGTVNDDTPKTGDGIHPKWFLSIGLLCIAMILFLKKDKAVTPVRVATAR